MGPCNPHELGCRNPGNGRGPEESGGLAPRTAGAVQSRKRLRSLDQFALHRLAGRGSPAPVPPLGHSNVKQRGDYPGRGRTGAVRLAHGEALAGRRTGQPDNPPRSCAEGTKKPPRLQPGRSSARQGTERPLAEATPECVAQLGCTHVGNARGALRIECRAMCQSKTHSWSPKKREPGRSPIRNVCGV